MKKIITFFSLFLLIFSFAYAQPFKVIEETDSYLILDFSLPEYEVLDDDENQVISIPGSATIIEPGLPQLPFFSELVSLPNQGDFSVSILDKKTIILDQMNIAAVEDFSLIDGMPVYAEKPNKAFYKSSQWYPAMTYEKGDTGYYRDNYFTSLKFYPVRYNPNEKRIEMITEARIKLNFSGIGVEDKGGLTTASYSSAHDNFFINQQQSSSWRIPRKEPDYSETFRSVGSVESVQIIVDEEGIYKVDYDFLMDSLDEYQEENELDIDWSIDWDDLDPRQLELRDEFGVIPIYFSGENDGSFDPGDYFEFYGNIHFGDDGYYDDYTSENVYTLQLVDDYGSRMAVENGGIQETDPTNYYAPVAFEQTVHLEEQNEQELLGAQFSWTTRNYYREDVYFWDQISAPDLMLYPFELEYPYQSNIRRFTAEALLFGLTYNPDNYYEINHQAIVRINSSIINNLEWSGQREQLFTTIEPIANNYLINGTNTLYVSLPGVPGIINDQVMLDYVDLTYWREYKTDTDYLKFSKPSDSPNGLHHFTLNNFSGDDISIYKLGASIMENIQISSLDMEPPYAVEFQDVVTSADLKYIALSEAMKKQPLRVRPDFVSNLKNPMNEAEYIIITGEQFKDSEGTLQLEQIWEDEGVATQIVSGQESDDEFNAGIESLEAIKEFLTYAYDYWTGDPLKYVLLLGDGILDERDGSVSRKYNIIPFRRVWVDERGAIASDNWTACIVGDDPVADVSISRINIWEEEQILDVAEKIQQYNSEPNYEDYWHATVTLCAGGNPSEGTFFAKQSEGIKRSLIPEHYRVNRIYCNTEDLPDSFAGNTTSLISSINDGTIYLQFMGHGGGRVWADYNLLNQADIATFNNENLPFVASLSCYGSAFNYAQSSCIGEELVLAQGKGAIAHIGFTGYGYKLGDEVFGSHLNDGMFVSRKETIGDVVNYTKARFFADYGAGSIGIALIQGCGLLGEARVAVKRPDVEDNIELNNPLFSVGDTLKMSADVDGDITQGKFIIYDENDVQISLNDYYPFTLPVIDQTITAGDFVIPASDDGIYSRKIRLFSAGTDRETVSLADFAVGQTAFANIEVTPAEPTSTDSIMIRGEFFDNEGISSINCRFINGDSLFIDNIVMNQVEGNSYSLSEKLEPQDPGDVVLFYFIIQDEEGNTTTTKTTSFVISGVDLYLHTAAFVYHNEKPAVKLVAENVGNLDSGIFNVEISDVYDDMEILATAAIDTIKADETREVYVELPVLQGNVELRVVINPNYESFPEINIFNNYLSLATDAYNLAILDEHQVSLASLDGNLICQFPGGLFAEETIVYLDTNPYYEPIHQDDVEQTQLLNGDSSPTYVVGTASSVYDSTASLPDGYNIEMTFKLFVHSALNRNAIQPEEEKRGIRDNYKVYRWENSFDKWVLAGGQYYPSTNEMIFSATRFGVYTVLVNNDTTEPDIDINVEGQEFTYGGYISSKGILSFLLSDANGIDIFSDQIKLWLDGEAIAEEEITISPTYGNLTNVPIKYQLNTTKGDHALTIDCTDVNGVYNTRDINFVVNDEFDIINVANYPNPVKTKTIDIVNSGRTRFTYVLTDDADEVYIKVYTVNGRLVKTFKGLPASVGYHEYPRLLYGWDCTDNNGIALANGVYFYRVTAKKGKKKIEKINKLAVLK